MGPDQAGIPGPDQAVELSAEQLERQRALDRSWYEAAQGLADPEFRAYLEASLRRLDEEPSAPVLTREQFLAQTK